MRDNYEIYDKRNKKEIIDIPLSESFESAPPRSFRINLWFIIIPFLLFIGIAFFKLVLSESEEPSSIDSVILQKNEDDHTLVNAGNEDFITNGNATSLKESTLSNRFLETGIVFPNISTEYLTEEDINELYNVNGYSTKEMFEYAINELYARKHYHFNMPSWSSYYKQFDWYHDYGYTAEYVVQHFNIYEKANFDLLTIARQSLLQ